MGQFFNYNLDQFKPSTSSGAIKPPTPTPMTKAPAPAMQSKLPPQPMQSRVPESQNTITSPEQPYMTGSFWNKAIDLLSTPMYAVGGYSKGYYESEKNRVLNEKKMPGFNLQSFVSGIKNVGQGIKNKTTPGTAAAEAFPESKILNHPVTKFGVDVISDPLTYVSLEGLGKIFTKIPGVSKLGEGANKITTAIKETPFFQNIAKKFVKGYGVPENVVQAVDDIATKFGVGAEKLTKEKEVLYKGLGKKEIEQIPKFLEPKGTAAAGAGVDLGKLKTELGTTFEKIKPVLHEERQTMKQLVYDAVKQGRITGDQAKEYLKRGYFPHVDFTREPAGVFENLKTLITGKKPSLIEKGAGDLKIGEYRSYFKQRGGAAGFTMNAPKATLTRQLRQLRDNLVQDALKTVKDKFGFKLGGKATMPEGFVPFLDQTPGRLKELKGFALPKNVAEYLTQSFRSYNEVERAVDQFNRLWKPTATSLNLPYHLTNVIGNLYNSWLGGMHNPQRFLQAVKGGFTPAERKLIEESGIVAKNQFVGDIAGRSFDEVMRGKLPKVTGWINKAGQWLENNARSALFLDTRERLIASGVKTIDATKEASKYANAHLFDYINGFTPFENSVMRRIFPFYSWTRKNIPLQLSKFYTDTGKQMATIKAFKAMNPEGQPEGDQAGLTIPTGLTDKGGQKIRMKPPLPIQDVFEPPLQKVSQMVSPLIKDIPQAVLYGLAKLAKPQGKTPFVPVDFFTGKERTGKSFPFLKQVGDIATSMATSLLRPVRTYQNVMGESGPLKTGRFFLPGFYREPSKEQLDLRRISEGKALSEDAKQQIYDIMNDPYLSYEEKQNKINDLMKYVK